MKIHQAATAILLSLAIVAEANATFLIGTPAVNQQYGSGATVSGGGSCTTNSLPYLAEVWKDYLDPTKKQVMNSNTGTTMSMGGYWSVAVAPPSGGWTPNIVAVFSITGADGSYAARPIVIDN